ncbi:MAG: isopentenyl phosphate kinase family protein [Candidatus Aenigmarchaeota archaeon]|nr:isopentenyl phosphate kinase family protein [Candidatus Aenigmarchaeota archaeon]
MTKPIIILKIGGSLIAPKTAKKPTVDFKTLKRICMEIGSAYKKIKNKKNLVVIHGAGNFGHLIVARTGIHRGIKSEKNLIDFAETQRLQNQLNVIVTKELIKNGVPAFPFQSSGHALMKKGKLSKFSTGAIKELLKTGVVPVAYGVPACDIHQGCSILSGDEIAPYLAEKLNAEAIIHATDVDGVFTIDPKKSRKARLIRKITRANLKRIKRCLSESAAIDVTGGMKEKVSKLLTMKTKAFILNGRKRNLIKHAMLGKATRGTVVKL